MVPGAQINKNKRKRKSRSKGQSGDRSELLVVQESLGTPPNEQMRQRLPAKGRLLGQRPRPEQVEPRAGSGRRDRAGKEETRDEGRGSQSGADGRRPWGSSESFGWDSALDGGRGITCLVYIWGGALRSLLCEG